MKIGIFLFATDRSLDTAVVAKRAEELGFESFWVPEHAVMPVKTTTVISDAYGRLLEPFVALARASAATQTITLGTSICLVPERNPLLLAKEVATLDHLCGGRFIFGIGAGWLKEETEIMGGDFPHRWTQTREAIMAMKELWTKDEAEYHGRYYNFPPVRSVPKPKQKPHPPIFLGSNAKNVFKRVVDWGDGWMPGTTSVEEIARGRETLTELASQSGRDPDSIEVMVFGTSGQFRDRDSIGEMERAGADRVSIWLVNSEGDQAIAEMEELAGQLLP